MASLGIGSGSAAMSLVATAPTQATTNITGMYLVIALPFLICNRFTVFLPLSSCPNPSVAGQRM